MAGNASVLLDAFVWGTWSSRVPSGMDPTYLQGLRDAKALVDEGIFSKEVERLSSLPPAPVASVPRKSPS
jgi:hypothetical protein